MSETPSSHSAVRRLNKAYVQIPPSPLSLSSYSALRTPHVVASSQLKENTPLRPFQSAMIQHASTSRKRKLSDREPSSLVLDGVIISTKKSKLSNGPLRSAQMPPAANPDNASSEYPNGFTYCHQCSKKRDVADTLRCTVIEHYQTTKDKTIKERLCVNKYCKPCLKNRYGEDIDTLKSQVHGNVTGFQCPRCRDVCNCPRCRKSKGLEAIGAIAKEKSKPLEAPSSRRKANMKTGALEKVKEKIPTPKVREPPTLNWTFVPTTLTQKEADERIFIREFFLRFGDFLEPVVAKTHIEELELIGGRPRKQDEETYTESWASDMCIKALIISLLGLVAKAHEADGIAKIIKATVKDLRSAGANLNKIWTLLSVLRGQMADASFQETSLGGSHSPETMVPVGNWFCDPAPPPPSVANTRRSHRQPESGINIIHSSQMIPVLASLVHYVLRSAPIREELDQGVKAIKDYTHDAKEATKAENERWEMERDSITSAKNKAQKAENKAKRTLHKDQLSNIDNSMKIITPSFSPRFMTLGIDNEGREYYALSPGYAEREAAVEYLENAASQKSAKPKKKGCVLSSDDRRELREWSWFVGVWGRKPNGAKAIRTQHATDESELSTVSSDDEKEEKWWGFWEPEEISKLAKWISIKSGFDDEPDPTANESGSSASSKENSPLPPRAAQLKRLVMELKEYACLLEWRIREDKCQLVKKSSVGLQPQNIK